MLPNLRIEIFKCCENQKNVELDAIVSDSHIQHKTKYLQTLTKNLENNFHGYFIAALNAEEIVAWSYIFIDSRFVFSGVLSGTIGRLYNLFPIGFNTAFFSSPVAEYNMFHIKNEYRIHENLIIEKMMKGAFEFLKKEGVELIVIKDHINRYSSEYFNKKFIHLHFMPGTYIDFEKAECTCFDEYLLSLKKSWRANIRSKIKRRKSNLRIEVINAADLSESDCVKCHELYFRTREKQPLKHECLSHDYFCECGKEFSGNCKMLIAKITENSEKIIGFAQLLENENDVINVRMGMDYAYNKEYNLYHHLLYENIIYCLKNKKKRLYTSQTCYRPKIELGAKLLPLHTYICFRNPMLQKVFGSIIKHNCKRYSELLNAENPAEILAKYKICAY
jgi:hypothetical protein